VSRSEAARNAALEGGATAVVPPDEADDLDADVAFETAGAAPAIAASLAAVRRGGRVLVLGGHPRPTAVDLLDLTVREIVLQGSVSHCHADFVAAADAISAGDLARAHRQVELAPLESGPALLGREGATAKRVLVPSLS
jgi:threonine dehydrogenase-like Zn-dependent dehydrogenase